VLLLLSPAGRKAAASCVISHQDKITLAGGEAGPRINYPSPTASAVLAKLIFTHSEPVAHARTKSQLPASLSVFRSFLRERRRSLPNTASKMKNSSRTAINLGQATSFALRKSLLCLHSAGAAREHKF
jgi:hypothetical protein